MANRLINISSIKTSLKECHINVNLIFAERITRKVNFFGYRKIASTVTKLHILKLIRHFCSPKPTEVLQTCLKVLVTCLINNCPKLIFTQE